MSDQVHVPAASPPVKEPTVPNVLEVGCAPELTQTISRRAKFATTGNRTKDVKVVARRYTD
jgi:hypothetical protein